MTRKKKKQSGGNRRRHTEECGKRSSKDKNSEGKKSHKRGRRHGHHGRSGMDELSQSMAQWGFSIKNIVADGNCLFRAFADQISGDQDLHIDFRNRMLNFFLENKMLYASFIEDDETFDAYHDRMSTEGTWGGHLELHLLSLVYRHNILIHQSDGRSWKIDNFPVDYPCVQLSYHDGDHYNSVRVAGCEDTKWATAPTKLTLIQILNRDKYCESSSDPSSERNSEDAREDTLFLSSGDELFQNVDPLMSRRSKDNTNFGQKYCGKDNCNDRSGYESPVANCQFSLKETDTCALPPVTNSVVNCQEIGKSSSHLKSNKGRNRLSKVQSEVTQSTSNQVAKRVIEEDNDYKNDNHRNKSKNKKQVEKKSRSRKPQSSQKQHRQRSADDNCNQQGNSPNYAHHRRNRKGDRPTGDGDSDKCHTSSTRFLVSTSLAERSIISV